MHAATHLGLRNHMHGLQLTPPEQKTDMHAYTTSCNYLLCAHVRTQITCVLRLSILKQKKETAVILAKHAAWATSLGSVFWTTFAKHMSHAELRPRQNGERRKTWVVKNRYVDFSSSLL